MNGEWRIKEQKKRTWRTIGRCTEVKCKRRAAGREGVEGMKR